MAIKRERFLVRQAITQISLNYFIQLFFLLSDLDPGLEDLLTSGVCVLQLRGTPLQSNLSQYASRDKIQEINIRFALWFPE